MSIQQALVTKVKAWSKDYGIIAKNLAKISVKTLVPGAGEFLADGIDYMFEVIDHQDDLNREDRIDERLKAIQADQEKYLILLETIESHIGNLLGDISKTFVESQNSTQSTSQLEDLKSLFDEAFSKNEKQFIHLQQELTLHSRNFEIIRQKMDEFCKKQLEMAIDLKEGNQSLKEGLNALKQLYEQLSLQIQDQQQEHIKKQLFRDFLVEIEHELLHHNLNRARVILENAFIKKTIDLQFKQLYECKINALQGHLTQIEELIEKSDELAKLTNILKIKQQLKNATRWIIPHDEYRTFLHQSGKIIGDKGWTLDLPIGIGGMGEVWKAYNLKGEIGAIKFVHEELLMDQFAKKKFFDEIDSLNKLKHRNIVSLKDWGIENGSHQLYLVMAYIEGETLRQLINQKAYLNWDEAKRIFRDLVEALYICHHANIIHKDIKPDNIILTKNPSNQPILIDFGIANIRKHAVYSQIKTTYVVGTDLYMSPEQKTNGQLDGKTDIYALGVTLLETLTGKCAIDGNINHLQDDTLDLIESCLTTWRKRYDALHLFEKLGGNIDQLKMMNQGKEAISKRIDELQANIQELDRIIKDQDQIIKDRDYEIDRLNQISKDRDQIIKDRDQIIKDRDQIIKDRDQIIKDRDYEIDRLNQISKDRDQLIKDRDQIIKDRDYEIDRLNQISKDRDQLIKDRDQLIKDQDDEIDRLNQISKDRDQIIKDRDQIIKDRDQIIKDRDQIIKDRDYEIDRLNQIIKDRDQLIKDRDQIIKDQDDEIDRLNQISKNRDQIIKDQDQIIKDRDDKIDRLNQISKNRDQIIKDRDQQLLKQEKLIKDRDQQLLKQEKLTKDQAQQLKDQTLKIQNLETEKTQTLKNHQVQIKHKDIIIQDKTTKIQNLETKIQNLETKIQSSSIQSTLIIPSQNPKTPDKEKSQPLPKIPNLKQIVIKGLSFNMVYCPNGEFLMTSLEKTTPINVKLTKSFWMLETQVTQQLWMMIMDSNPSHFKDVKSPVESVHWITCLEFCNRLSLVDGLKPCFVLSDRKNIKWDKDANGYRLPTEAEWEYAVKAGTDTVYSGSNLIDEVAWYHGNLEYKTQNVKKKKPNAWGLYDMSGNVWEWCLDQYDQNVYQHWLNHIDPILWSPNSEMSHVLRGGSCWSEGYKCLVNHRFYGKDVKVEQGFRIVRNA